MMKILSVIIILLFHLGVSASDLGLAFLYVCILYEIADPLDVIWVASYVAIIVYSESLPMYY